MPIPEHLRVIRERIGNDLILAPGVCGLVFNEVGEILLGQRSDTGKWAVIGGMLDPGENPADGVVREVFEETAVVCEPVRISGVYSTPVITYPNGDKGQYVITAFRCRAVSGEPRVNDDESLDVRYFPLNALPPDLSPKHLLRIQHAAHRTDAFFERSHP